LEKLITVSSNTRTFAPLPSARENFYNFDALAPTASITVVGAGVFGSWAAYSLLNKGFKVTIVDPWGPAHARSSSGDETRVIRSTYGSNQTYFDLNVNALALWKNFQDRIGRKIFHNTGVVWFCYEEKTALVDDSIPFAKKHNMEYEYLSPDDLCKRFPQVRTNDLHHAWLDPFGGYLNARESVQLLNKLFIEEGGNFIQASAAPGRTENNRLRNLQLSNGNTLQSDAYVFACGSWLGKVFPELLAGVITCTKQEVYYFGTPVELASSFEVLPVWVDVDGKDFYYGIPGNNHRGFKLGVDIRGSIFDPTNGDHVYSPDTLERARRFIAHRFPDLENAPLIESRVCPYENSPDGNFIFDLHPQMSNVFILGGGSGHGFKHGPAIGQLVAEAIGDGGDVPSLFQLKDRI
jgi:glycine/D-amino acid oxidase-like deaminating enzyme